MSILFCIHTYYCTNARFRLGTYDVRVHTYVQYRHPRHADRSLPPLTSIKMCFLLLFCTVDEIHRSTWPAARIQVIMYRAVTIVLQNHTPNNNKKILIYIALDDDVAFSLLLLGSSAPVPYRTSCTVQLGSMVQYLTLTLTLTLATYNDCLFL